MSLYDRYKHLLGRQYVEGDQDCFGLGRDYYKDNYDLFLENYARPVDFAFAGIDLIMTYFKDEGFELIETSLHRLELGDALLFRINGATICNHIGMYVGNQMFLHHLYNGLSKEDPYNDRWKARTMGVLRHPEVQAKNMASIEQFNPLPFINPHALQRKDS